MLQQLKADFKQRIEDDEVLQAKIAHAFGNRISTVKRWVRENHIMLTHSTLLNVIREHEGLSKNVELTEEKELALAV